LSEYKVTIIGGGPGGYETAIRLNQYGIECLLIEEERVGGVCLNRGCIPTKALVKSAELYYEMSSASNYGLPSYKPELDYEQVFNRKKCYRRTTGKWNRAYFPKTQYSHFKR